VTGSTITVRNDNSERDQHKAHNGRHNGIGWFVLAVGCAFLSLPIPSAVSSVSYAYRHGLE
jgi:hypothetical protein